ncbi:autophagocytosis associated protein [Histomonas meleagridis]|uniref:autophagocytosis associated protein n=1 Tax=Histomonas meleagridis TaxID=135588 RepID=UPI00355967C5|nr:autophagocytosis associated protein [Histomonas meleagridis]KAH0796524.1 autophagocytosis associated protein [Histomonas meleagridis]
MKHALYEKFMNIVTPYLKVQHSSTLLKDGKITPEEFVIAGDSLISVCPNWSWSSAESSKCVDYLPKDKQFLINRRIISQLRATDFNKLTTFETDLPEGWIQCGEPAKEVDLEDDDQVIDLDEIDIDSIEQEEPIVEPTVDFRTYDISIVYDKYYSVPHIYMFGVDSIGQQLTLEEMYQDISAEHAEKTVTLEKHPFYDMKCLSIHPCHHATVMMDFIERLENPEKFCAPLYFFLFLKFIHTVIPTIDVSTPTIEIGE